MDDSTVLKAARWLGSVNSHAIGDWGMIADACEEIGLTIRPVSDGWVLTAPDGESAFVPRHSFAAMKAMIEARGKGGTLAQTSEYVTVAEIGYALCMMMLGVDPGQAYMGMGFAHDARVRALMAAGRDADAVL